jgi:hypothetical protein
MPPLDRLKPLTPAPLTTGSPAILPAGRCADDTNASDTIIARIDSSP